MESQKLANAEAKGKAYNTYTAPQAAYRSCSGAFCVTDKACVQPIGRMLSLHPQTLTYNQTAIRSPRLPFNGLHHQNPCNYMDYYSCTDPGGMEG